jgi:hypothetical protein
VVALLFTLRTLAVVAIALWVAFFASLAVGIIVGKYFKHRR